MGSPWERGRRGDLAHPVESKISSQSAAVGATRRPRGSQKNNKTGSMRHQDLIMHRVCIIVHISSLLTLIIVIVNNVLLDYLFQENKSYGSKKPFAFILWCTRKSRRAQVLSQANIWALSDIPMVLFHAYILLTLVLSPYVVGSGWGKGDFFLQMHFTF